MNDSGRQRWLGVAVLVGALYLAIGQIFAALAGAAASGQMRFVWRLSAFVISGVAFAAHIVFEHFRLRSAARSTAWHTSVAVALGGFGLALAANLHEVGTGSGYRPRMLVALVAWPLLTGVPALIVALVLAALLGLRRRRTQAPTISPESHLEKGQNRRMRRGEP